MIAVPDEASDHPSPLHSVDINEAAIIERLAPTGWIPSILRERHYEPYVPHPWAMIAPLDGQVSVRNGDVWEKVWRMTAPLKKETSDPFTSGRKMDCNASLVIGVNGRLGAHWRSTVTDPAS